jgi:hypothetical protein
MLGKFLRMAKLDAARRPDCICQLHYMLMLTAFYSVSSATPRLTV